jgi:hypothetical protein
VTEVFQGFLARVELLDQFRMMAHVEEKLADFVRTHKFFPLSVSRDRQARLLLNALDVKSRERGRPMSVRTRS